MDRIQDILKTATTAHACKPMSEEEYEQFKADSFNAAPGSLNEQDGYNCQVCLNKGLIMRVYQMENGMWTHATRDCKCMAVRATIRRMERSGLKNIIRDYTFDKYQATEPWQQTVKNAAMEYAKHPEGWFFIGGQSGAGKTHICTAICRDFLLAGRAVKYMLWRDEAVKLKSIANDAEQYGPLIGQYKNAEVLYIDDLFKTGKGEKGEKQAPTGPDINLAFEIINFRYNDPAKITIISSECSIADLLNIDEALGGRIAEKSTGMQFSIKPDKSKNYRLKGATEL